MTTGKELSNDCEENHVKPAECKAEFEVGVTQQIADGGDVVKMRARNEDAHV